MAGTDKLRELFPDLAEMDDSQLYQAVGERSGLSPQRVQELYGAPSAGEAQGDFMTGVKADWDSLKATGYGALALAGASTEYMFGVGEGLQDFGLEGYARNMEKVSETYKPDVYSWEGATSSPGNFVDAVQYYAGRAIPAAASALVSGGVGALAGKKLISEGVEAAVQRGAKDLLGDRIGSKVTREGIGSTAGIVGQSIGQESGEIYGQAALEATAEGRPIEDVDLSRVYGYGLAAGALESAGDIATLGAARLGPVKNLLDAADSPNRFVRAGTRGGTAAGVEGGTEGVQTGLEDMGTGKSFDEARFMDPTSVFAGTVSGTTIGGAGGLISPGPAQRAPAPDVGSQAQLAAENAELARMAQEAEAQQDDAKRELRDQFAPTFMSLDEFGKQRAKRLEAEALDPSTETGAAFTEWRKANDEYLTDAATTKRLTKAFLKEYAADDPGAIKADYLAALDEHAERMQAMAAEFSGEAETDSAREGKTEDTTGLANMGSDMAGAMADGYVDMLLSRHTAGEVTDASGTRSPTLMVADAVRNRGVDVDFDTMRGIARSVDKIMELPASERAGAANALVAQYGRPSKKTAKPKPTQEAQPTQEAKPQKPKRVSKKDQARADAEARLGPNWEVDNPDLSFMVEDGKSIYPARKGEQPKFWRRLDEIDREQAEAEEKPAEKTEKAEKPVASEEGEVDAKDVLGDIGRRATEYAEQKLGPDWRKIDKDLEELLKKRRFAAFNRRVDELAPAQESTQSLVAKREEAPSPPTVDVNVDGLSGNEKKVWDVVRNAFANNDQDGVIQVDGKWNATKIAELAGIKSRQAAHVAITRLKPKIAKQFGVKPDEIASRLRATRVKGGEAAASFDDAQEVFDPSELREGAGFGTKASIDQGAHEGLTKEDIAYSKGRSEEPNPIADQRAEEARAYRTRLENAAKETYGALAVRAWGQLSAEGDVPFARLSERDQTDWVVSFSDYAEKRMSAEQLVADQRDTARLYDAEGGVTMEELDAQDAEKAALAGPASRSPEGGEGVSEGGRPDTGETRGDRGRDDGEGDRPARPVAEASEQEAEIAGAEALDTGVVGEQKARPKVEVRKARKLSDKDRFDAAAKGKKPRFSVAEVEAEADSATAQGIRDAIKWLVGDLANRRTIVVRAPEDLIGLVLAREIPLSGVQLGKVLAATKPYGFVQPDADGTTYAYFFADNITPGRERGAVMHEIGGHIGFDALDQDLRDAAYSQILQWADAADDSAAGVLARRAKGRVDYAALRGGLEADTDAQLADLVQSETIAYFIEEAVVAGYNPTEADGGPIQTLLHKLWGAFKKALSKFTGNADAPLSVTDFLDLARGAAGLDLIQESSRGDEASARFSIAPAESADSQRKWAADKFGGSRTTQMIDDAKDIWAGASNSLKPMSRFIRDVAEEMPSAKAWNDALLEAKQTRRQWSGIVDEIANRARQLAPERRALVNDFLAASTIYQKWGYDPKIDGKKVKVDPLMARKFARLTAEEQQVVRDIFQHGDNVRAEMDKTAKDLGIDKLFTFQSRLDGPYAPLKRFGDSAVVLRSQELLDAEAALAEDSTKANRDAVEKLKSNGEHYVVKFFDTMGAAKKFARANEGKYASATASKKAPDATPMSGDNTRAYQKVLAALNAHDASKLPADSKKVVQDLVKDLYFQSLDEKSARLSGAQRLNREGYDKDMIRSFVSHGRSQATLLAQMKHGGAINGALIEARNESRRGNNQEKLRNVYRVIAAKNRALLTPRSGLLAKIEDHVLAANTTWMLSTNIGYHVTNRLQPLWSIAKIGGDLNAYTSAWRHFLAGTKIGRKVVNTSFLRQLGTVVTAGAVDLNNKLEINVDAAPEQYRNLLRTMQLRDLLDVGLEEDLNIENRLDTGYATLNKVGDFYRNLTHRLYQVARYVEASNRVASAIAAFDTARSHPQALRRMKMTPEEYAIGVIQDTQGDFSAEETPLLLSKLPRTTTQFRKFQVMMAWLHADALKRTFSPNTPAHERAAAIRTTAYLFATTGFMAGTIGLPAANLAAMAFQMAFGDDDEPKDLEFYIRDKIGDPQLATLVARGVPAFLGVDMSTRMSLNDIFQPWNERYASPSTEREGALAFTSQIILGPTSGQVANIAQAVGRLQEGDIARGVEYLAPKGIRSMMSSLRLASEGMETRSGVVAADPREFDLFDLITNATGLPSSFVTNLYWTRGQQYELKEHFSNETSRLKAAYWDAYRDRDRARVKELREEFRELQKAKRRVAPFFHGAKDAPKPQPISSLTNTPRERRRQSREAQRAVGLR